MLSSHRLSLTDKKGYISYHTLDGLASLYLAEASTTLVALSDLDSIISELSLRPQFDLLQGSVELLTDWLAGRVQALITVQRSNLAIIKAIE